MAFRPLIFGLAALLPSVVLGGTAEVASSVVPHPGGHVMLIEPGPNGLRPTPAGLEQLTKLYEVMKDSRSHVEIREDSLSARLKFPNYNVLRVTIWKNLTVQGNTTVSFQSCLERASTSGYEYAHIPLYDIKTPPDFWRVLPDEHSDSRHTDSETIFLRQNSIVADHIRLAIDGIERFNPDGRGKR